MPVAAVSADQLGKHFLVQVMFEADDGSVLASIRNTARQTSNLHDGPDRQEAIEPHKRSASRDIDDLTILGSTIGQHHWPTRIGWAGALVKPAVHCRTLVSGRTGIGLAHSPSRLGKVHIHALFEHRDHIRLPAPGTVYVEDDSRIHGQNITPGQAGAVLMEIPHLARPGAVIRRQKTTVKQLPCSAR